MIKLRGINKTYDNGKIAFHALKNINLEIGQGEFVAIMGASGSGKSTLLHLLGFLDVPDSGEYFLFDHDMAKVNEEKLSLVRNGVAGFVFQQFFLLPGVRSVDNVNLPQIYSARHLEPPKAYENAMQRLEAVGLKDRALHVPNEMSGGERQRVAIARALINEPLILFADEPTGNLDTQSESEIMKILKDLHAKGMTIVMVTHEQEIAAQAQRIVTMRDGQIISDENKKSNQKPDQNFNKTDNSLLIKNILDLNEKKIKKTSWNVYVKQAWRSLWVKKVRAVLSMLGILIGVAAVIAMLALGTGATKSIEQELSALGTNLLIIRPGSLSSAGISFGVGGTSRFTLGDVKALKQLSSVQDISGQVSGRGQAVFQNKNWNTSVQGVDPEYAGIHRLTLERGRFFNESESVARERVVVIGKTIVKELFGTDPNAGNVIGQHIKINRINFKVIGVLPEKGFSRGRDQDDILYVPIPTAMYRLFGKIYVDSIEAQIVSEDQISPAKKEIQQILSARHRLDPNNEKSVDIRDMSEIQNAVKSTTTTISILLGSVAAIALVVGGIGIMNIMLVSVTERTREIGLRKAVGATKKDIMNQFLVEAIVMTLTGGFLGIVLGFGVSKLISLLAGWATVVSLFSVLLSSGFSIAVGLIFGLWPAQQAANLKTIEALRYE